ncbi:UNVERIFIED_CONTAM: hypothetical protein PYX00_005671 [Menopon gallinae]|uniref:Uncharacterized protein n=1 Tax=Menopon gallinae TaxID=328185 RepID=A0AAW2HSL7_9NEOP
MCYQLEVRLIRRRHMIEMESLKPLEEVVSGYYCESHQKARGKKGKEEGMKIYERPCLACGKSGSLPDGITSLIMKRGGRAR